MGFDMYRGRKLVRAVFIATAALFSTCLLGWLSIAVWANRAVDMPKVEQRQHSYDQAINWIRRNEGAVLGDGNVALWWMIKESAEAMQDQYLFELLKRADRIHYPPNPPFMVWKRMLYPQVVGANTTPQTDELGAYQKFFLHALTCQPVAMIEGDSSIFLKQNMCRPQIIKVMRGEAACTTHQLIGLHLFKRSQCVAPRALAELETELFEDVIDQLFWDPRVRDSYLQRVLVLRWLGRASQVKPVWIQRVLAAQQKDGGWAWDSRLPELPSWLQLGQLIQPCLALLTGQEQPPQYRSDFHPTAQGLLLMALSLRGNPPP